MDDIGTLIKQQLALERKSAKWLSEQLCCDRTNIYKLFQKDSVDTELLMRISEALDFDFFQYLSEDLKKRTKNRHSTKDNF